MDGGVPNFPDYDEIARVADMVKEECKLIESGQVVDRCRLVMGLLMKRATIALEDQCIEFPISATDLFILRDSEEPLFAAKLYYYCDRAIRYSETSNLVEFIEPILKELALVRLVVENSRGRKNFTRVINEVAPIVERDRAKLKGASLGGIMRAQNTSKSHEAPLMQKVMNELYARNMSLTHKDLIDRVNRANPQWSRWALKKYTTHPKRQKK